MRGLPHFHPLPVGSRRKGRFWEYACSSLCCKYNWMRMRGCRLFPLTFTRRHTPSWHPQFRLVLHSQSHRHQLQWVGQRKNRIVHAETIIASKRLPIYSKEHKWIVPPLSSRWFYLSLSLPRRLIWKINKSIMVSKLIMWHKVVGRSKWLKRMKGKSGSMSFNF